MFRRAFLLLAMAGIYVAIRRSLEAEVPRAIDQRAEAQWANEGGDHTPVSI